MYKLMTIKNGKKELIKEIETKEKAEQLLNQLKVIKPEIEWLIEEPVIEKSPEELEVERVLQKAMLESNPEEYDSHVVNENPPIMEPQMIETPNAKTTPTEVMGVPITELTDTPSQPAMDAVNDILTTELTADEAIKVAKKKKTTAHYKKLIKQIYDLIKYEVENE